MVQKCSQLRVLEVFFTEPTTIHFIKEIGKKIKLAPTSVRNNVAGMLKEEIINKKKSKPFDGLIANRDNEDFIFYKKVYNLYSLKKLKDFLISEYYPQLMVVYGSYSLGEDVEESDIDIFILSKSKKEINLNNFEKKLKRRIHLMIVNNIDRLDENLKKKIQNGIVLYGGF